MQTGDSVDDLGFKLSQGGLPGNAEMQVVLRPRSPQRIEILAYASVISREVVGSPSGFVNMIHFKLTW